MTKRIIALVLAIVVMGNFLTACSDITNVDQNPSQEKVFSSAVRGPAGQIQPYPRDLITFNFDETAPASSTLVDYPSVATWRLVLASNIPNSAILTNNMHRLRTTATVEGFDPRGNQIASGSVYLADYDALDTWYCDVSVAGNDLDMADAGALITNIVADIELGGDGTPFNKAGCWWKATKAAGAVAGSVVGGAVVLKTCFVTGGRGCYAAISA